jgi:hypothetical protein
MRFEHARMKKAHVVIEEEKDLAGSLRRASVPRPGGPRSAFPHPRRGFHDDDLGPKGEEGAGDRLLRAIDIAIEGNDDLQTVPRVLLFIQRLQQSHEGLPPAASRDHNRE